MSLLRKVLAGAAGPTASEYDYDFIVIGGGSGGLAAAKEAARLGAKTCLFDFVRPTSHGTKWGLGGTCVNVGCIPKKLMHRSARIGHSIKHDFQPYGWKGDNISFDWDTLVHNVQMYIKQLNFGYRNGLRSANVEYINALAKFDGDHTICYTFKGETKKATARYFLIAVGGRPVVPNEDDVPGAQQYAITSDDLFSLKKCPGKTLVVGGSYIALECAGFLNEFGYSVTVAVRSILLRYFDRQCAEKIGEIMKEMGCQFKYGATIKSIVKQPESNKLLVTFNNPELQAEEFDTVLYAVGRLPETKTLGLETVGIVPEINGKIRCDAAETTTAGYIYVAGDAAVGRPELTPVAIKTGELLARRLFKGSTKLMDYHNIPTTVFTPVEYGCCGLSEEDAIEKYGEKNIEVYLYEFNPLEASAAHWEKNQSCTMDEYDVDMTPINLSKIICLKTHDEQIIGFHCLGLYAGETTQGYALALKTGLTKSTMDEVVGIHPTDAESFHSLTITKRSGLIYRAAGGCGGGKCG